MPSLQKVIDAIDMIDKQHLDIRTITMGISLLDCASEDAGRCCEKIYDKICHKAENLVKTGESIEREFGIPIVNKRISVTPMVLVAGGCRTYWCQRDLFHPYEPSCRASCRYRKAAATPCTLCLRWT